MRGGGGGGGGGGPPPPPPPTAPTAPFRLTFGRAARATRRRARTPGAHANRPWPRALASPAAVRNGYIKRITDADIQSSVLEVAGSNVSTTYIACPADEKQTLGIKLPFLVMIIKNINKYFTFEVTILDDKGVHRRFRASNFQVRRSLRHTRGHSSARAHTRTGRLCAPR